MKIRRLLAAPMRPLPFFGLTIGPWFVLLVLAIALDAGCLESFEVRPHQTGAEVCATFASAQPSAAPAPTAVASATPIAGPGR